jgi:hypothetical protein
MDKCLQLDFFEETTDLTELHKELKEMHEENARVRKRLFATTAELGKLILKLQLELDAVKNQMMMVAKSK